MATQDQEISCHMTPLEKVEPEDANFSRKMFSIQVIASFMPQLDESPMEEEAESELYDMGCDMTHDKFLIERDKLFQEETSSSTITQILADMNVPLQPDLVNKILNFARQMETNKSFENRKVIHLRVEIDVQLGSQAMDYDDDDDVAGLVPASKTAIEGLEKIRIEESKRCLICLEGILIGTEATRMPCSHDYHSPCIVTWLHKSRACPLCRSEIS